MKRNGLRRMILLTFCLLVAAGIIVVIFTTPDAGLDAQGARLDISQNHLKYTGADNAVSAIYLNIRLWDTLFEALVLLVSAVAVISFSRSDDHEG